MKAKLLTVAIAMTALAMPTTATAAPSGPGPGNAPNAKSCQKGGWKKLVRADGTAFANQGKCTSYAAKGGRLFNKASADPRLAQCKQALADAGLTAPADANYILGTDEGYDPFEPTAGNDVICGFGGDDIVFGQLTEGDIFLKSGGRGQVNELVGGTYIGSDSEGYQQFDLVDYFESGTFNGGGGDDLVNSMEGGTFNGGDGNDTVYDMTDGTFNGEAGCDRVRGMNFGTFNPGDQSTC